MIMRTLCTKFIVTAFVVCGLQLPLVASEIHSSLINVRTAGKSYIITPRKQISLAELMQARNRATLDAIILNIAHHAQKDRQFKLLAQNVDGQATWRMEPTSRMIDTNKHPRHCTFCDIVHDHSNGYIVAENKGALAFLDIKKFSYPRCLIIPKKGIVSMGSISLRDLSSIHSMAKIITTLIAQYPLYRNFSLEMHTGASGKQTIFHLHWHFKVPHVRIPADHAFKILN